jgi:2,4-dienoyl-CoA reductase-like NADH-dependent reductase (Old Yellow Enzyme family)
MTTSYPNLFRPITLAGVEVPNRIVFTAHGTKLSNQLPTAELSAYHESRAAGGAGLIVLEAAGVHPSGDFEDMITAYSRDSVPGYRHIAESCHRHNCPVVGQLFHPGRESRGRTDGVRRVAWAPSVIPGDRHHVLPKAMPVSLINEVVEGHAQAAGNLNDAGLDGIEILASHGYLLAQFLSPRINVREDGYGGDLDRRLRMVVEIIDAIRRRIGQRKILGIRLSAEARVEDGADGGEMTRICEALEAHGGLDYFSFVVGSTTSLGGSVHVVPPMEWDVAYVREAVGSLKESLQLPVMMTGRINQPQVAEQIIADGAADFCGMTRALIADPLMPEKARAGAQDTIRACIGCNQACVGHTALGYSVSCIQHPESGRELHFGRLELTARPRQVLVAGGGPAGLKAAAVAAARGHNVTLYERERRVGGQVLLAEKLPSRAEFGGLITNLVRECELAQVSVVTGVEVTPEIIDKQTPDVVILAVGSQPYVPVLADSDGAHIVSALDVIRGEANVGSSVVIADWRNDWVGLGVAEMLALAGCRVRLCVNGTHAGETLHMYVRDSLVARVHRLGVEITPYGQLFGVVEDTVYFQHSVSGEPMTFEETDTLVTTQGHYADEALETALDSFGGDLHVIGDCLSARTAEEAIYDAVKVARAI